MNSSANNRFRGIILFAGISLAISVMIGALGAHSLKAVLPEEQLSSLNTAVRYQFFHSLGLLIIPLLGSFIKPKNLLTTSWLLRIGILLFSGSIYLLSTIPITQIEGLRALGPITPIGGLCFISGWIVLVAGIKRD